MHVHASWPCEHGRQRRCGAAVRGLTGAQPGCDSAACLVVQERGLTSKQETIRAVVANACADNGHDKTFLGQEIMLSRLSQKLATMPEHPDE